MRLNHEEQPLFWGWPEESRHYNPFSIFSGIHQDHAINAATNTQAGAATDASKATTESVATVNPQIQAAAERATAGVTDAATQANKLLNPYATSGETANTDLLNLGTAAAPTLADLQIDPGFKFRQDQGELALERAKAATGGIGNGGYVRDALKLNQDMASQEYQNAFNRFLANKQTNISALTGVASRGLSAAGEMGSNLAGAARYAGDTGMAATGAQAQNTLQGTQIANQFNLERANALAQGITGSTAARDNGINSFLNQVVNLGATALGGGNMFGRWGGGGSGAYSGYGTRWGTGLDYEGPLGGG